ncbi:MAG: methyltransferase domain-containing protein [Pseudomonadales bacterium]
MTLLYHRVVGGKTYEVRSAGASVRLYTNGAFHSQWHPKQLFQGAVWDLLSLPALLLPRPLQTVLALGVGGGTALHQLYRIQPWQRAIGIEIDGQHLRLAKRFFKLQYPGLTLCQDDALAYVASHDDTYDYLVDDLFLDGVQDPERPAPVGRAWLTALFERTTSNGVLIQNHLEVQQARACFKGNQTWFKAQFSRVLLLRSSTYTNGVLAAYRGPVDVRQIAQQLKLGLAARGLSTTGLNRISIAVLQ